MYLALLFLYRCPSLRPLHWILRSRQRDSSLPVRGAKQQHPRLQRIIPHNPRRPRQAVRMGPIPTRLHPIPTQRHPTTSVLKQHGQPGLRPLDYCLRQRLRSQPLFQRIRAQPAMSITVRSARLSQRHCLLVPRFTSLLQPHGRQKGHPCTP